MTEERGSGQLRKKKKGREVAGSDQQEIANGSTNIKAKEWWWSGTRRAAGEEGMAKRVSRTDEEEQNVGVWREEGAC